jgi:hypothetical protein
MPMLRAVRLLQSVEAGITLGPALETLLADPGRVSDLSNLLGMREQVRRMANSDVTMTAIIASPIAIDTTFSLTNPDSKVAVEYMALSPTAMTSISGSLPTLNIIVANATAWDTYTASAYYASHVLEVMHLFAGIDEGPPLEHTTLIAFLDDGVAQAALVANPNTLRAAIKDPTTLAAISVHTNMLGDLMVDTPSLNIMVVDDPTMYVMVRSATALTAIGAVPAAKALIAATPSAIKISMAGPLWMAAITGSSTIEGNLRNVLVNGLDLSTDLGTTDAAIDDATSAPIIAASTPAMQAINEVASATTSLLASPLLTTYLGNQATIDVLATNATTMITLTTIAAARPQILANPVSMAVIAANITMIGNLIGDPDSLALLLANATAVATIAADEATMNTLIADATAFPSLLANATAKAAIFASPTLVATMATAGSASLGILQAGAVTHVGPSNNAIIGTFQDSGIPGDIITLTIVLNSIVATTTPVTLAGTNGTNSGALAVPGTSLSSGPIDHIGAYTDMTHDVGAIGATAATQPTFTYYQF